MSKENPAPRGLRTVIYNTPDLERAKDFYRRAFGLDPYFDQPFYVGFTIGGFELGLDPNGKTKGAGGTIAYWGVESIDDSHAHFLSLGAKENSAIEEVGEGIRVSTVTDPFGNVIGLIENPHFKTIDVR